MANIPIEAMLSSLGGTQEEWNLTSLPIPDGLLVYTIDTKDFKLGNGHDLYKDLPIFFNANNMSSVNELYESLPSVEDAVYGKFIIVDPDGTGYTLSDMTIDQVVTTVHLTNALSTKINKEHTHVVGDITNVKSAATRDIGTSPGNVPIVGENGKLDASIVPIVTGDSLDNENLLSYLVTMQLADDVSTKLRLHKGYADEFNDESGVRSTNGTFLNEYYSGTDLSLISNNISTTEVDNPLSCNVFLRCAFDGDIESNLTVSVSRNDGVDFVNVPLEESKMSGEQIRIFTGLGDFSNAPSGNDLVYRIQGGVGNLDIHGICLRWA